MNFDKLKELVNDSFLDKNLKCRKRRNEEGQEEVEIYLPLSCIDKFKLEEEEEVFIIQYLGSKGIEVKGSSSCYSDVCDNYIQYGKMRLYKKAYKLPKEVQQSYLEEYEKSRDIKIRNKLVEANLYIIKIFSRKYQFAFGYDYDLLMSYGSEALISSIENYDSTKGNFNTYINKFISLFLSCCIEIGTFGVSGSNFTLKIAKQKSKDSSYYEYFETKRKVEEKWEESLKAQPEMIEEIALELERIGYCDGKILEELKTRISIKNPYSYEQIEEELCYYDEDTLYNHSLEKVYQQELTQFLENAMEKLSKKKKEAIGFSYGLGNRKQCTLEEIGKKEGVGHETIRQRKESGIGEMKKILNSWKISDITKSFLEYSNHEYEGNVSPVYRKKK